MKFSEIKYGDRVRYKWDGGSNSAKVVLVGSTIVRIEFRKHGCLYAAEVQPEELERDTLYDSKVLRAIRGE